MGRQEENQSKQYLAYEEIRRRILKNEFPSGMLLVERQLCSLLDVSRTPIREALRMLASEGLVEAIPGKGVFVSKIRFEDMMEIFEIREALERMSIRLFIMKKDDSLIEVLKKCVEHQESDFKSGEDKDFMRQDMEFHSIIMKGAKNKRLYNIMESIYDQIAQMAYSVQNDYELRKMAVEDHRKMLGAVLKNLPDEAELAVKEHVQNVKEYHMRRYFYM